LKEKEAKLEEEEES